MFISRIESAIKKSPSDLFISILVPALVFIIFWPVCHSFFVDDDFLLLNFADNSALKVSDFLSPYLAVPIGVFFRPLTLATFVAMDSIFGFHPLYYHWVNLVLHCGNALLIYILAKSLLGEDRGWHVPAFASLILAVHPRVIDVVTLINSLPDLLCTFFVLTSLSLFVWQFRRRTRLYVILSAIAFAIALFSKEAAVLMPLLLVILWFSQRRELRKVDLLRAQLLADIAVLLIYFTARYLSVRQFGIGKSDYANYGVIHLSSFYLKAIVAFFLPAQSISWVPRVGSYVPLILGILVIMSIATGIYYIAKRPHVNFAGASIPIIAFACVLASLAPASFYDFALRSIQENRLLYLPLAFFAIGFVSVVETVLVRSRLFVGVLASGILAMSFASRGEVNIVARGAEITQALFYDLRRIGQSLPTTSEMVILDSPRIYKGGPVGLLREGAENALTFADSGRLSSESNPSISTKVPTTWIVGQTFVSSDSIVFRVEWRESGDSLVGTVKDPRDYFLDLPILAKSVPVGVSVGVWNKDTVKKSFQEISLRPISAFSHQAVFLSFGLGKVKRIILNAGGATK